MRQSLKFTALLALLLIGSFCLTQSARAQTFPSQTAQMLSGFATAAPIIKSFKDGAFPDAGYAGTDDAYLMETRPSDNFGSETILVVDAVQRDRQTKTFGEIASILAWDVSSIPANATVTSVQVTFEISNTSSREHFLYEMTNPWDETTVSWDSIAASGAIGTAILGSFTPGVIGSEVIVLTDDGKALVQSWVDGTKPNNGLVVKSGGTRNGIIFGSSEGIVGVRPQLTVHYDDPNTGNILPTASFSFTCTALSCAFDATASSDSDGTIVDYSWDFGDSTAGSTVNPSHLYAADGTYTVELTVTDNDGATDTTQQNVTVSASNIPPTAEFDVSCSGLLCDFNGHDSVDSDGMIVDYSWNFGDGSPVLQGHHISHLYAADGTYTVELTITDDDGATDTAQLNVTVPNIPPTAEFDFSCSGLACDFDAHDSVDSDGTLVDYSWNFGDGSPVLQGHHISHLYAADGTYTVELTVTDDGGATDTTQQNVTVPNTPPTASFSFICTALSCAFDATASSDSDGTIVDYSWDFGDSTAGSTVNPSHLYAADGIYSVVLTVMDNDGATDQITQSVPTFLIQGCAEISLLACGQVRILNDYLLNFSADAGGLPDKNGVGTGFTMVDPPSNPGNPFPDPDAPGLWSDQIQVDTVNGVFQITTTSGIQYLSNNNLDNALGVGLNVPSKPQTVTTRLTSIPPPAGGYSQAGLWFGAANNFGRGTSENNYIKFVLISPSVGTYQIQALMEESGVESSFTNLTVDPNLTTLSLELVMDPATQTVVARYDTGSGFQTLSTFSNLPELWFSFDQAGIDPTVATRSYAGIFATHRLSGVPQVFSFDEFSVTETLAGGGPVNIQFDRWTFPVPLPTAMVVGPDGRLYVTELFGTIHAFTLDHENQVVLDDEIIDTVRTAHGGDRLTLGLTVDPSSTPGNVILWVSHSNGSVNSGLENSGIVSRLSGANFQTIEDRITGLPRAIANHAMNEIHFGPDGRLYIAAGGNTGAGAANAAPSEFGDRSEQPLSAAILAADVNAPGFSGDCATPVGNSFIPGTCDVEVYASGLRNSYDFEFHKNGSMYATDNGLGVTGTYPPSPTPPCTLFGDASLHNPGTQPDLLLRVLQGKYYGHPNPFRDAPFGPECVFKDGSFQGAAPLPNYELPLLILGDHKSANGIMEYKADTFFSRLMGQLLITNFSVGDDVTHVLPSDDGLSVLDSGSLVGGFVDPLPIEEGPNGVLYVGEINAFQITVLVPLPLAPEPVGFWSNHQVLPEPILDAGGVGLDGKLYVVSGKTTGSVYVSTFRIFDPVANSWTVGPDVPGPGVEDAKAVAMDGKIYVVGGGTSPFTNSVTNFAVYDPATGIWTSLAPMSQGRGGPVAEAINGKIYVAGGRDPLGNSLNTAEVYDPATDSWSPVAAMATRRDNAGSATFNGKLYVFGGRIRDAGGVTIDGQLNTMEIYDPATDLWSAGAPMPTGRRAMVVGNISGRAQVMGGENNGGQAFSNNEEYDPVTNTWRSITSMATPRHGMAGGTINGKVYTAGGGVVAGTSFSDIIESFRY